MTEDDVLRIRKQKQLNEMQKDFKSALAKIKEAEGHLHNTYEYDDTTLDRITDELNSIKIILEGYVLNDKKV